MVFGRFWAHPQKSISKKGWVGGWGGGGLALSRGGGLFFYPWRGGKAGTTEGKEGGGNSSTCLVCLAARAFNVKGELMKRSVGRHGRTLSTTRTCLNQTGPSGA